MNMRQIKPTSGGFRFNWSKELSSMLIEKTVAKAKALIVAAIVMTVAGTGWTSPAAAADRIKVGVLTCAAGPSIGLLITSSERINCTFQPDASGTEQYYGRIRQFGLDIGGTVGAVIIWAVFAKQSGYAPNSLAGEYVGVSAEETVVVGLGANVLVGGNENSIALQPLSIQGQAGLNFAIGVTRMVLEQQ
jgi:Protein of unknown function (DUF992)